MKIDRLFAITHILINKKSVTAAELAEKFNVSIRTIYRDIDILSANGIPIYTSQGKGGGISIIDSYSIDKTILSDDEQKQILMALETVNATGEEDVSSALNKLGSIFKKNSGSWVEIDFSNWEQNDDKKEYFSIIKNSILNKQAIKIIYANSKGEKSSRVIEPLKLIFKGHCWYLYAYCRNKKDYRFFKLYRISELVILEEKFNKEAPSIINKTYKFKDVKSMDLVLKIDKSMEFRIYDELNNSTIEEKEDYFIVKVNLEIGDWIYSYLLSYREKIEILEPIELRENMKKIIKEIMKNYFL